jgi:FkbM family methyltransferase
MLEKIKTYLRRYPTFVSTYITVYNKIRIFLNNIRDIREWYLPRNRKAQLTPYGFTLQGSHSIHHLGMQLGIFESEETSLIQNHLNQSQVFVDVGANIGFYSCLARSLEKYVITIEPLSRNLEHIYGNLIENNWNDVEVFPVGLSNQPGLAVLYGVSNTSASLINNWAKSSSHYQRIIATSTLDILLGNRFVGKKLVIKIDVEGVEHQVLLGALNTMELTPRPTWFIEICLNEFHPSGLNPNYASTFDMFWKRGYKVHTADLRQKLIQPADVDRWIKVGYCDSGVFNYIITPV